MHRLKCDVVVVLIHRMRCDVEVIITYRLRCDCFPQKLCLSLCGAFGRTGQYIVNMWELTQRDMFSDCWALSVSFDLCSHTWRS